MGHSNNIAVASTTNVFDNLQLGSYNTFSTTQTNTWNNIQIGNYSDMTSEGTNSQFAITINSFQPAIASSFYSAGGLCRNLAGSTGINIHGANILIGADPGGVVNFLDVCPSTAVVPTVANNLTNKTYVDSGIATLTNKSISGSTNTLTNIPNSALVNSSLTVTAGTGLSGGGLVSLGGSITLNLSTPVSLSNGGTNTTSLTANGITTINSAGTTFISNVLTNGQLLIGNTGNTPSTSTLTGTSNQINIVNGAGSITLSLPQDIATGSSPTFASQTLSATTNQLILGTTNTTTISSVAPSASRTYTISDAGGNDTFTMNASTQSLTNKTIIGTTNTVRATQLSTTGADVILSIAAPPSTGQSLIATSATNATWQNIPAHITINTSKLTVSGTGVVRVAQYPWKDSIYGTYTTRTVSMWVVPSTNRNLVVNVLPTGGASLGSITITAGSATGIYTFTFTNPGADRRLDFTVNHTVATGVSSVINGITLELT